MTTPVNGRSNLTTNLFDLNTDYHQKTDGLILSIEVLYDIDSDKLQIDWVQRNDFVSEQLLQRVAEQIEHALRAKSTFYALQMQTIESKAGLPATTACGCTECPID